MINKKKGTIAQYTHNLYLHTHKTGAISISQ